MRHFLPNGYELVIRPARIEDAAGLLDNFQRMTKETDYLLFTHPEAMELNLASEEQFVQSYLDNPRQLLLVAEVNNKIVGSITVNHSGYDKKAHTAEMGIAVEHAWSNLGIGRRLMTAMIRWAEQQQGLRILYLNVFSTNEKAMQLYRNFGFLESGRLPKGILQREGIYADLVMMYKDLRM
ncbi:GNAT family N-acetyltransferase [Chitinophaga vietnamensis]|uniref:GNAT family N-acetyltransferase n=1 Tax=Chitinophaga vietnamensis TaxID=2593957 RepID=UPI0011773F2D|nr:GNAT family N-acetyltransferase [Chitinophaga vietnamensis]